MKPVSLLKLVSLTAATILGMALPGPTTPASAADGVLEINEACAVNTGCFAGDTAGYPVTINQSGSYKLTSNLVASSSVGTSQIDIDAGNVELDLAGFSIGCSSSGSCGSFAIRQLSGSSATVRNGNFEGYFIQGIVLLGSAVVSNMRAGAQEAAISVGSRSIVTRNQVASGGSNAINMGDLSSAIENHVNGTFGGIGAGHSARLIGNVITTQSAGIDAGDRSIVRSNRISSASVSGGRESCIKVGEAALVEINDVGGCGGNGIETGANAAVRDNVVNEAGSAGVGGPWYGLVLGADTSYRGNTLTNNAGGPVSGGVNLGDNYCAGPGVVSASCP